MPDTADIRMASPSDAVWMDLLWKRHGDILGAGLFGLAWKRYWEVWAARGEAQGERWVVVPEAQGFAHYKILRNGTLTLYDIATVEHGRGVGRQLWDHLCATGRPIFLKTDADNARARGFYEHLGCVLLGYRMSRNGKKRLAQYAGGRHSGCAE